MSKKRSSKTKSRIQERKRKIKEEIRNDQYKKQKEKNIKDRYHEFLDRKQSYLSSMDKTPTRDKHTCCVCESYADTTNWDFEEFIYMGHMKCGKHFCEDCVNNIDYLENICPFCKEKMDIMDTIHFRDSFDDYIKFGL